MAAKFVIHERALRRELEVNPRMRRYMTSVGNEIRDAAILVFTVHNINRNEGETSELTPPKYIASFRVRVYQQALRMEIANVDPGWHLVEWGAHPGGGSTFVLRYKPLTRGLLIVGRRFD